MKIVPKPRANQNQKCIITVQVRAYMHPFYLDTSSPKLVVCTSGYYFLELTPYELITLSKGGSSVQIEGLPCIWYGHQKALEKTPELCVLTCGLPGDRADYTAKIRDLVGQGWKLHDDAAKMYRLSGIN